MQFHKERWKRTITATELSTCVSSTTEITNDKLHHSTLPSILNVLTSKQQLTKHL